MREVQDVQHGVRHWQVTQVQPAQLPEAVQVHEPCLGHTATLCYVEVLQLGQAVRQDGQRAYCVTEPIST